MIVSTAMYYTGEDLFSNTKIEVEKKLNKKKQWKDEILKKEENLFSH